ncbi:MAG TPA: M13 family metallopeptidase N-terminal domain-containing protein, partial [Gemmatimonadaceae bacterium]|nr:M13 family metallopeptidase N-terminal domain-containing protein [Gemmatimonadaceae bacterium]
MRAFLLLSAIAGACALSPCRDLIAQTPSAKPIDRTNLDTTCSACSDFFDYANGGWLRTAQIPATKTSLGSFGLLSDRNEAVVHGILDDDAAAIRAATVKPGTNQWKIGTFYASCMDT